MNLSKTVKGTEYIGTWGDKRKPVYDILDINGLNQIVGYVKHKCASEGTVLFRGQCHIYPHIIPSIEHDANKQEGNKALLRQTIEKLYDDLPFKTYFDLDQMIKGWEVYIKTTFEAVLQHYGAKTFSVDFVDNLWVALWFGLFSYDSKQKRYFRRTFTENEYNGDNGESIIEYYSIQSKRVDDFIKKYGNVKIGEIPKEDIAIGKKYIEKIVEQRKIKISEKERREVKPLVDEKNNIVVKINDQDEDIVPEISAPDNYEDDEKLKKKYELLMDEKELALERYQERNKEPQLYLFLYLAETEVPEVQGLYLGKKTYAVDLRRAIPSFFLRPVAQHGWIVKGKDEKYSFDDDVVCVLRLSVKMVDKLLGYGNLLSQENFFPAPDVDEGYLYLLQRQEGSGFEKRGLGNILPEEMITCYEYESKTSK